MNTPGLELRHATLDDVDVLRVLIADSARGLSLRLVPMTKSLDRVN
jgi:hypothetical protein